jgi:hypothetical protein
MSSEPAPKPWSTRHKDYIAAARRIYADENDDIEVDDDAEVSSCDNGVWVQGWLWVPNDEMDQGTD